VGSIPASRAIFDCPSRKQEIGCSCSSRRWKDTRVRDACAACHSVWKKPGTAAIVAEVKTKINLVLIGQQQRGGSRGVMAGLLERPISRGLRVEGGHA
jgi:hypothetical protein